MNEQDTRALDKNTKVTISAAAGAAMTMFVGYLWLDDRFDAQDKRFDEQDVRFVEQRALIESMQVQVDVGTEERWRESEQSDFALRLAISNPGLRVPDPKAAGTFIVVDAARIVDGFDDP